MNIAVFGAKGKVGRRVVELAQRRGHNVWQIDKKVSENPLDNVDVAINFATAEATRDVCEFCLTRRCPLVSGATGLDDKQEEMMSALAQTVKVISKPNFAEGVETMFKLCDVASKQLHWDCAVVETHRKGKKDAPSGTARGLASVIAQNTGSFSSVDVHALRLGENVGRHEVTFENGCESLTIIHQAYTPDVFALGAIRSAEQIN